MRPGDEAIRQELEKILSSRLFAGSERMSRFLRFGVEQAVQGKSKGVKEYVVGVAVFDRGESYDPRADPVVRVEARRLRSKLREYYEGDGSADAVVIDFPLGGYVPVFTERNRAVHPAIPSQWTWTWWRIACVAALIAIAAAGVFQAAHRWIATFGPGAAAQEPAIAVLPFVDLSPQKDQAYFCDGITDELISALSKIDGLRVPARTSVFQMRGADLHSIQARLRVSAVLEGSVQKEGDRLRITVQLIRLSDNSHLWSETYDNAGEGLFAIEDKISRGVVEKLRASKPDRLLVRQPTTDIEAHNLYLRGRQALYQSTPSASARSSEFFKQAVARDPGYAPAYAGLADSYSRMALFGRMQPRDAFQKAAAAAQRAIELDESLPDAHTALANARLEYALDWAAAEREHRRALELNPNDARAHEEYGWQLMYQGRFEEAIRETARASELDPLSARVSRSLGTVLFHAGRYDDAIAQCRRTLQLDPEFFRAYHTLGRAYTQKGMFKEAVAAFYKGMRPAGDTPGLAFLGYAYAVSNSRNEALKIIETLKRLNQGAGLATVYSGLGDKDRAFEWLNRAYKDGDWLLTLKVNPEFAALRSDPRFGMFLGRVGLRQ